MRAYQVHSALPIRPGVRDTVVHVRKFAGTQAEARQARETIVNDYGVKKSDVEIEEVEIPTAKSELLGYLNDLIA
jgi:hypothetical protein